MNEMAQLQPLHAKIDELTRKVDALTAVINASPGIRSLPVTENTALVRLESGLRLYVDSRDIGVGAHLVTRGIWESNYVAEARKLIRPGTTCIDIGANLGFYTVTLASITGPSGRVLAFEPNPWLHSLVLKSIKANGFGKFVSLHQVALAEKPGRAMLNFKTGDFGGGSIYIDAGRAGSQFESCDVEVRPLTSYDIDAEQPIFIKIDSEGAEYNILRGARQIIEKARDLWIMMEFTPAFIERHIPLQLYIQFLMDQRLKLHLIEGGALQPVSIEALAKKGNCYVFARKQS